jgi:pSer/pThr/pTyr-binding forkhead associated (FHA) protein
MVEEPNPSEAADPDRTDTLPVLDVALAKSAFERPARLDLPRLDETVRSVEERIERQSAEYAALAHSFERVQESEAAAVARANALAAEVVALRDALEAERQRDWDTERALFEKNTALELARVRLEEAQREAQRLGEEARGFKDSLATRDATIVQVLNSLGERDAQLTALQREHANLVPDLEARARAGSQFETELQAARSREAVLQQELQTRNATIAALSARIARGESELGTAMRDVRGFKAKATAYLENLRSREWRRGFIQSRWQDEGTAPQALQTALVALEAQRDELKRKVAELSVARAPAAQAAAKATRATPAAAAPAAAPAPGSDGLVAAEQTIAQQAARLAEQAAEIAELKAAAEATQEEMTVLLAHLQAARRQESPQEAEAKQAAERSAAIKRHQAEAARLAEALAGRDARLAELEAANRELQSALERTRGALDEREFLIRRLERSETSSANALGRLQNKIERLGVAAAPSAPSAPNTGAPTVLAGPDAPEFPAWAPAPGSAPESRPLAATRAPTAAAGMALPPAEGPAQLIRIDAGHAVSYVLQRRNQVGRAPTSEVHIDASSVSRLHALIVTAPGGAIIEDVKSTNGTFVNGRRILRQLLRDGDLITIGEAQFQFVAERPAPPAEPRAAD